jgi:hypothetical protein
MAVSVSVEERDALCEVIKAQKGSLSDAWTPLSQREWEKAEDVFKQYLQDCRFLEALHLAVPDESAQIKVGMRTHELKEALTRLMARRTAQLVIEESGRVPPTPHQEAFQECARLALRAAERALERLAARYEVRYVVVDGATDDAVTKPMAVRDFAMDACEVFNESESSEMNRTRS